MVTNPCPTTRSRIRPTATNPDPPQCRLASRMGPPAVAAVVSDRQAEHTDTDIDTDTDMDTDTVTHTDTQIQTQTQTQTQT